MFSNDEYNAKFDTKDCMCGMYSGNAIDAHLMCNTQVISLIG